MVHGNADSGAMNDLGEPCAGESHARFDEGGLETEPESWDRSACNEVRGQRQTLKCHRASPLLYLPFRQQKPEVGRLVHQTPGSWEARSAPRERRRRAQGGTVTPGELKRGGKGGRESERLIVPKKQKRGDRPGGTPWREGGAVSRNFWRKDGGHTEARSHLNATTEDSGTGAGCA
ncbi:MAG: hypothetical protein HW416_1771 [Chloroflexi bacterium]|nr:hypothetical protein [Chloroflexota bacterium]